MKLEAAEIRFQTILPSLLTGSSRNINIFSEFLTRFRKNAEFECIHAVLGNEGQRINDVI